MSGVLRRLVAVGAGLAMGLVAVPASAMSGGTPVPDPAEALWMATLALKGPTPLLARSSCGGALVAPDRVLTAAHCLDGADPAGLEVHLGASVLSADPGVLRGIAEVRTAPGYAILPSPVAPDQPELSSAKDDLAVIRLDRPVYGVPPLRPVDRAPAPGTPATLYGHGITGPGAGVSDTLNRGELAIIPDHDCAARTPATVDGASVLCAADPRPVPQPVQACFGDSGGPAVVRDPLGRPRLAGIFSFAMETTGKTCGTAGPGAFAAFADVTALPWMR